MPIGISIHIGINELSPELKRFEPEFQLQNCINDARSMTEIADKEGYKKIIPLHNEKATFENLYHELDAAAQKLRRNDTLFLSFAGHGAQVPHSTGKELNHKDEAWVLYDRPLIDSELMGMLSKFKRRVRILIVEDCCRKGDLFYNEDPVKREEAINNKKYRPRLLRMNLIMEMFDFLSSRSRNSDLYIPEDVDPSTFKSSIIILHACAENQLAVDKYGDNPNQGFFTSRLLTVWNKGRFEGNYFDFHHNIIAEMPPKQSPDLETIGFYNPRFLNMRPFAIHES